MGLVKRTYVDGETVITADNLNDIQDEIIQNASDISEKGTYSKPTGGIPSTDMTTAVQTSLGKADTAYQKPSGGIPSTDLASSVQTSLGKADTALQSSDIDSTLTVTGKAADAKKTGDEISDVRNTLNNVENGLAIIVNGDTCSTAVPVGGYAYIKNNTHGLAEGLYTNTSESAFPTSGGTANSSVFTSVSGGGLNDLKNSLSDTGSSLSKTQSSLAILANGNVHGYIEKGEYTYVKNHNTLAEGLYQANSSINVDATLSTDNLRAISGDGIIRDITANGVLWGGIITTPVSSDMTAVNNAYTNASNYSAFSATSSVSQGLVFYGFKKNDASTPQAYGLVMFNSGNYAYAAFAKRINGTWSYSTCTRIN